VRELVEDREVAPLADRVGDVRAEHVGLHEGDRPGVLHRAHVVLRHEDLVVLAEGEVLVEGLLVELDPGAGHVDDVLGVHVLGEGGAGEDAHRDRPPVARGHLAGAALVVPGDERDQIGGDPLGGGEDPGRRALARGRRLRGGRVGDDPPVGGRGDGELEGGLEVGLLEAGEHASRVGDLELRVEVDLLVHGVHEAVQPLAGVHVPAGREDPHRVLALGEGGQLHAGAVEAGGRVLEQLAVELDLVDLLGDQVEEGLPRLGGGDAQRGLGAEGPLVGGEVQADLVGVGAEEGGATSRLVPGEVL
jgi:hypothetical protein